MLQEKKHKLNKIRNSNISAPAPERADFFAEKMGKAEERLMLMLALKEESLLNDLIGLGVEEFLIDPNIKKIFKVLISSKPGCDINELFKLELSEDESHLVNHLSYSSINIKTVSLIKEFERLKSLKKREHKIEISREIKIAEESKNIEKLNDLRNELANLK